MYTKSPKGRIIFQPQTVGAAADDDISKTGNNRHRYRRNRIIKYNLLGACNAELSTIEEVHRVIENRRGGKHQARTISQLSYSTNSLQKACITSQSIRFLAHSTKYPQPSKNQDLQDLRHFKNTLFGFRKTKTQQTQSI